MKRLVRLSKIFPNGKGKEEEKRADLRVIDLRPLTGPARTAAAGDYPRSPLSKNIADRVIGLCTLILLLPLFALVALVIRLTSPGPIVYRQVRIGMNRRSSHPPARSRNAYYDVYDRRTLDLPGKPFIIYKFRTMVDRAEDGVGPTWARKDDPRVTLVGKFLRRFRIDETPQFLNVLLGDMSIVGPRPERPTFVRDLVEQIPEYAIRLRVKPGITGLAQVKHHYDTCLDDVRTKLDCDLEYIRTLSMRSDLRIVLKTVWVVLTMKGAH